MKTKILSMLLTVAMLVAMVPMFTVSTSAETGTVYEVTDATSIATLIADTTKNVAGNTMKLTQDLTYEPSNASLWAGLNMNVDGGGHTVNIKGGTYTGVVALLFSPADGTSEQWHAQIIKNLAVKTVYNETTATDVVTTNKIALSFFGQAQSGNKDGQFDYVDLQVINCHFDVKFQTTGKGNNANSSAAILICHEINDANIEVTIENCYLKADLRTGNKTGQSGAIIGRRWNGSNDTVTVTIKNSVFDIAGESNTSVLFGNMNTTSTAGDVTDSLSVTVNNCISYDNVDENQTTIKLYNGEKKEGSNIDSVTRITAGTNTVTTVKGYQTTAVAENKFDLRLVGLVDVVSEEDLANYSKVGFVVVANYANINTKWTSAASNKVYESLKGYDGETGLVTYEAPEGDYLYALAIKNIPANAGDITFNVTPYYIKADGTTVYGATTQFTVDVSKLPDNTVNAAV